MTMTTGAPPEANAGVLRRWATEQLELPAEVSAKESRAAFMQRLRDEDFMPPLAWQQASRALLGRGASESLTAQVLTEEEARLRAEVESFAVEFFSLEIDEREKRWRLLRDQSAFSPPLTARLRALEKGLRVPGESDGMNPKQRELARDIRELFVLRPQARAVRRQELFRQFSPPTIDLDVVAHGFFAAFPELAALEPDFLHHLATWNLRAAQRRENRVQRRAAVASANSSGSDGNWKAPVWIIVACLAVFFRFLGSMSNTSAPAYKPIPIPTFPKFDLDRFNRDLDDPRFQQQPIMDAVLKKTLEDAQKANSEREKKATQRDNRP
jgi:hypothetical protein